MIQKTELNLAVSEPAMPAEPHLHLLRFEELKPKS
jgi:hypothetical protein